MEILHHLRYIYSSIKKMTNSFSENLGTGGFGSVYKGQLSDGPLVAVKILNESNENGEDFMNEVASISRTSHINIVALLGFCFEGSKRALIYDFMPNGTLEKFIGKDAESVLGWEKLIEIALDIARGLEYLHQGCNTRILHLDIKPQNILLDKDLNPRISDFGLAKLCPNRASVVSMMVARGTIGYIAPEVFSRNYGEVSYKSDVYSYGMLVLEMVGGRTTIDRRELDRTSEIYFPHCIYKQLEADAERDGNLAETVDDEDESQPVKRNMIIVGLWWIQTNVRTSYPIIYKNIIVGPIIPVIQLFLTNFIVELFLHSHKFPPAFIKISYKPQCGNFLRELAKIKVHSCNKINRNFNWTA